MRAGTRCRTGRLHKLEWSDGPGIDSAAVDFRGDQDVTGMLVRVYFWADSDGHPAGLTYRITQPATDTSVPADLEWRLDVVLTKLSGVKIGAPSM